MPRPHSNELRERAVAAYEAGEGSYEEVAEQYEIGSATLERWVGQKRRTGAVDPRPRGGGNFSPVEMATLEAEIAAKPDATTFQLAAAYNRRVERKRRVHRSSILRALHRAGYVFKKNGLVQRSATDRTSKPSVRRS
jgi:transposase